MERGRWQGQNFQPLKEVQRLEEEEEEDEVLTALLTHLAPGGWPVGHHFSSALVDWSTSHILTALSWLFVHEMPPVMTS